MRKITLLLALMAFVGFSFAQNCELSKANEIEIEKVNYQQQTKAAFDVIWSEDFDGDRWQSTVTTDGQGYKLNETATLPEGWKIVDKTGNKYYWHWSDVGPRGVYTNDPFNAPNNVNLDRISGSTDNGVMMLEGDWFNSTETGQMANPAVGMDAYIQYGPIDFSNHTNVIFNMKMYYRYCCSANSMVVEFSTNYNPADNTGDWELVHLDNLTNINAYTVPEERDQHINVSNIVGNESSVYFRIHQINSSHYFWMIDDIKFYVAPDNDIQMKDGWADYIYDATTKKYALFSDARYNFWGGYSQIPNNVVGSFVKFRGAVYNNGINEAKNVVLTTKVFKDNQEIYTKSTSPKNLLSAANDTLSISSANFIPVEVGHYQVSMTIAMDDVDQNTTDNGWEYNFSVVLDTVYSRVRHGNEDKFGDSSPANYKNGGKDGDMCAQRYIFPVSEGTVKVKGVYVYITNQRKNADMLTAIENGEVALQGVIAKRNSEGKIEETTVKSNQYNLLVSDTSTWVYLPFKDEGNLELPIEEAKEYFASVAIYTGNENLKFYIGTDNYFFKQPIKGGYLKFKKWGYCSENFAIDLVIDNPNVPDAVNETRALNNVKIYPNPFNNIVTVANLSNSKNIIISNVLGQTVMNVPVTTSKVEINTADLDKGVYLITIVDNNGNTRTEKLVKK